MNRLAAAATGLIALVLAGFAVVEVGSVGPDGDADRSDRRLAPDDADATSLAPGVADHADEWATMTLQRPLFSPSRRPSAPAVRGTAQAGPPGLPRLAGTLVSPAGKSAIFVAAGSDRPVLLGEGGRIGDWTVNSIGPGQVVLSGPDGRRVVRPSFALTGGPRQGGAGNGAGQPAFPAVRREPGVRPDR